MTNAVYVLSPILDDPRFDGFGFVDKSSICGSYDINDDFAAWDGVANQLMPVWKPRTLSGVVGPHNDYPAAGSIPIFSERAVSALKDLLDANGELLRCDHPLDAGSYWAYNVTTVCDTLDLEKSTIDPRGAQNIRHHEFHAGRLAGNSIFKIPQSPFDVYVAQPFVNRVVAHNLEGFWFKKVWPLSHGTNWRRHAREELKKHSAVETSRVAERPRGTPVNKISCRPPAVGEEQGSLNEALREYERNLSLDVQAMTSSDIQTRVADELDTIRPSRMGREQKASRAFWCAVAWGESINRELGWEWAMLVNEGGGKTMGVVSPNRSYAVAVFQFIETLATDQQVDNTSLLLFNLIKEQSVPPSSPGELLLLS
ncbi:MAG: hypothetical protein GC159_21185 [Phycisphaera sp.]|nr:hypothetical protein [Phycisphaera sp.]